MKHYLVSWETLHRKYPRQIVCAENEEHARKLFTAAYGEAHSSGVFELLTEKEDGS